MEPLETDIVITQVSNGIQSLVDSTQPFDAAPTTSRHKLLAASVFRTNDTSGFRKSRSGYPA